MTGRLIEVWKGGTDRDPEEVVAAFRARAPERLCATRRLTRAERRLWRHLSERDRMGVDVFEQVPVHVPEEGLERVMTFFIPRFALCVEVACIDFSDGDVDDVVERMVETAARDELLREAVGIATMRCSETQVLKKAGDVAAMIRWDLGLTEEPRFDAFNIPR